MKSKYMAIVMLLLLSALMYAQEEETNKTEKINHYKIVVSATLEETTTDKIGNSVTVVTAEEIERMQARTVLDVLSLVPGLQIIQNGGLGGTASVFIRGAKSEHTLLMIDGVEMNDVISPGRSYNFADLTTDNIERIEIIRGPQSILYGSDAIGGVINIITRKADGDFKGYGYVEGGSYGTYRGQASVTGGNDGVNFAAAGSYIKNDGFSAADEELEGNSEEDGYRNTSFSARLGLKPTDKSGIDFTMRYIDASADIDGGGGAFNDDPNSTVDTKQLTLRGQGKALVLDNKLELITGLAYSSTERITENGVDAVNPFSSSNATYNGDLMKFDGRATFHANENIRMTAGFETEEETGFSEYRSEGAWGPYVDIFDEQAVRTNSFFGLLSSSFDTLTATAGVRYDDHDLFGDKTTYRLTIAYTIPTSHTIIRGSFGTGFKAPSLYQLYSSYGSESLEPEESTGWDVGIEQPFANAQIRVGANWFYTDFENMIDFDSLTFTYANIAEAKSQGFEVFAKARVIEGVEVEANYTYTDAEEETTEEKLLRRAKHRANAQLNFIPMEGVNLNINGLYVGTREDQVYVGWLPERIELESFFLINVAGSVKVMDQLTVFGRIHNLFDEEYEWVSGYATAGLSGYFGAKVAF
jgi:vitamin B12 transporter